MPCRISVLPGIPECVYECEADDDDGWVTYILDVAVATCHADRFANALSDWSCKKDFAFAVDFPVEIAGVHGGGRAAAYAIGCYLQHKFPQIRAHYCSCVREAESLYVDRAVAYESGDIPYRIPTSPRTMIWF